MAILPDGTYDAIVIEAEPVDETDFRLELTITLGPHIGRVIALPWTPCRHKPTPCNHRSRPAPVPRHSGHSDRSRRVSDLQTGVRVTPAIARSTALCVARNRTRDSRKVAL